MSFEFAQSFSFQLQASRHITGLNRTSELIVIAVCICSELPFSIPSVSIYYGTQLDIRGKGYCRLTFVGASIFNFQCLDILQDSFGHPSKSYCCLNFIRAFVFHLERLDILRDSVGHMTKKLLSFEFATSFCFQFRVS